MLASRAKIRLMNRILYKQEMTRKEQWNNMQNLYDKCEEHDLQKVSVDNKKIEFPTLDKSRETLQSESCSGTFYLRFAIFHPF